MSTPDIVFYRRSAPFFGALLLLAVPAFWPSYIVPKQYEADWHVHVHGLALFLWAVMLIVQPWLVGSGRLRIHRQVGKASYVIAPTIVVSTVLLAHYRMAHDHPPDQLYFLYLQLWLTVVFAKAYVQAIRYRRSSGIHARYMVCTGLTMVDPIVARLLYNVGGIEPPWMQIVTFLLVDAILLALWWRDRRAGKGVRVFPAMLGLFVAFEIPTFFLPMTPAWEAFGRWFGSL
jgi:hypothetical protein